MIPSRSPLPSEKPDVKFTPHALEDYQYWQKEDPAVARRIARLIAAIRQDPFHGIGHPEPLKHQLSGYWSRRITREHRLVYGYKNGKVVVIQCRYHY